MENKFQDLSILAHNHTGSRLTYDIFYFRGADMRSRKLALISCVPPLRDMDKLIYCKTLQLQRKYCFVAADASFLTYHNWSLRNTTAITYVSPYTEPEGKLIHLPIEQID